MSDLFVSELLILLLLFPVIIRPFFKNLRILEGLVIIPSLALILLGFALFAHGISLTVIPLILFSLLVFFINLPRLVRYSYSLKTDYFDTLSRLASSILFLVFCGVLVVSIILRPEAMYHTETSIKVEKKSAFIEKGLGLVLTKWEPEDIDFQRERNVVIYLSEAGVSKHTRPTLTRILVEQNYTMVEPFLFGNNRTKSFCSSFQLGRSLNFFMQEIFQNKKRDNSKNYEEYHLKELEQALSYVQELSPLATNIYIVAEGSAAMVLYNNRHKIPDSVSGLVLLDKNIENIDLNDSSLLALDIESFYPRQASNVDLLCLYGSNTYFLGYGELGADDVLFAKVLRIEKDIERKRAEIVARKIITWIELKKK